MSIKFTIKSTAGKAEKEGDAILRFSGVSEPFRRGSERDCKKVGVDGAGNPRLVFNTGLDKTQVKFYKWYTPEEQKALEQTIDDLKPLISDYYGGEEVLNPSNTFFWKDDISISKICLTNENVDNFLYDTAKPDHALLYLSIAAGAFSETIAPTRDWAEMYYLPHYMSLETESTDYADEEQDIKRSDAHAALSDLRKNYGKDSLFILAWCLQYDTNAFGAQNYQNSEKDLVNYHIKYIDGKLVTKKKRNMPKVFLDYYNKWVGQQTRPALYVEAYVKAGEYFSYIVQREKKFVTSDGTILGNTISEAVANLMKPKFNIDLEKLRDQVETKWKE